MPGQNTQTKKEQKIHIFLISRNKTNIMTTFKLSSKDRKTIKKEGEENQSIVIKESYEKFTEDLLGLGKIETKSSQLNALSVIFDLEGFTNFCKQIDPQLAVPEYLSEFLRWIFVEIKKELIEKTYDEGYSTWSDLPFLSKYLGDGLLFIWDTQTMDDIEIQNVVVSMYEICQKYVKEFLPKIATNIISPPTRLRCGIARGIIYSVGDGNDFVGPCINMSARLQKLHTLTFCFSRRGINPNNMGEAYKELFAVKKVDIRGIGNEELVCVSKSEFSKLKPEDKSKFTNL